MVNPAASVLLSYNLPTTMGRSASYISPSKKIRNLRRLVSYLKQKIPSPPKKAIQRTFPLSSLADLALPYPTLTQNPRHPNLTSSTTFTSFPQPCTVCEMNQCQYNLSHLVSFNISGTMSKVFDEFQKEKKPPDDPSSKSSVPDAVVRPPLPNGQ